VKKKTTTRKNLRPANASKPATMRSQAARPNWPIRLTIPDDARHPKIGADSFVVGGDHDG